MSNFFGRCIGDALEIPHTDRRGHIFEPGWQQLNEIELPTKDRVRSSIRQLKRTDCERLVACLLLLAPSRGCFALDTLLGAS
jgi:hypothetical protein